MSKFLNLGARDFIRSLMVAGGTVFFMAILPILQAGSLPNLAQLKVAGISALSAGVAYLLKNFFTNSKDQVAKMEPK